MPRRLLKKILPQRQTLAERWFLRPFATALKDPVYWTAHRRGVVRAFALGLFICFIPLPVHLLISPIAAIALRANIPVTMVTIFIVNPLTALPTFFTAYWVGCRLLGTRLLPFHFAMSWDWFSLHFVSIWKPLLLGCFVLGVTAALCGYLILSLIWRIQVHYRYQKRPWKLRRRSSASDQDTAL